MSGLPLLKAYSVAVSAACLYFASHYVALESTARSGSVRPMPGASDRRAGGQIVPASGFGTPARTTRRGVPPVKLQASEVPGAVTSDEDLMARCQQSTIESSIDPWISDITSRIQVTEDEKRQLADLFRADLALSYQNLSEEEYARESERLPKIADVIGEERAKLYEALQTRSMDESQFEDTERQLAYFSQALGLNSTQEAMLRSALLEPERDFEQHVAHASRIMELGAEEQEILRSELRALDENLTMKEFTDAYGLPEGHYDERWEHFRYSKLTERIQAKIPSEKAEKLSAYISRQSAAVGW